MADKDDPLTPEERAFFDSRGEKPIPVPTPPAAPASEGSADTPPPPSEPSADPAAVADKEPPVQDLKEQRHIPYDVLKEEREKRHAADERARQAELMAARMEERFKLLAEASKPPPQAPAPPPRADQDIFGAVDHLSKEVDRRGKEIDGYKEQLAAEAREKQMKEWAAEHEAYYIKENKIDDYAKSLHFLRLMRSSQLTALGTPPSQINEKLKKEELDLLRHAANVKKSPAEMAYSYAKASGYNKEMKLPGWDDNAAPSAKPDARQQLDRIEAGQRQAGSSMSDVGGSGKPMTDLSLRDLAKMSEREFGQYLDKHPDKYSRLKRDAFN